MSPYVLFLAMFQASSQQAGVPLTEDCSDSSAVLATISASAPVEVRSSMAGSDKPCYAVTAMVEGKPLRGYVHGNQLDAVAEYERQRAAAAASIAPAVPSAPNTPAVAAPAAPIPVDKPHHPAFSDFSALDMKRRPVSVHGLKGKVNLVCFWSPNNANSSRELLAVNRLYGQFQKQGLDALGVNTSGDSPQLRDTLEDYHLAFRNVPNGYQIGVKYNVDFEALPTTYVLNEKFEVIASGLHNKALEDLVKKLITAK